MARKSQPVKRMIPRRIPDVVADGELTPGCQVGVGCAVVGVSVDPVGVGLRVGVRVAPAGRGEGVGVLVGPVGVGVFVALDPNLSASDLYGIFEPSMLFPQSLLHQYFNAAPQRHS